MKKVKVFLAVIVLGLTSTTLLGAEESSDVNFPSETIILRPKIPAGRPNAPSRIQIECAYHDGVLEFSFPESVEVMMVDLINAEQSVAGIVYRDAPTLELPPLCGEFEIRCTTDDGRTYYGMIQLSVQ
ncbi:MAG: hypothetical protein K2H38_05635 [Muribaculaceae bacterium]|nr:hypothetical protein [Muribaculaceae bacterium]